MVRNSSIRRRLVSAVVGTQLVLTVGLVLVAVGLTRRQLRVAFDAGLHGRAMSVAALVRYSEEAHPLLVFENDLLPPPLDREHPDLFRIQDGAGKVIAVSPNWPGGFEPASRTGRKYWTFRIQGRMYRAVRLEKVPVLDREAENMPGDATLTVFYAAPTEELNEAVWRAGGMIAIGSLVLLGIATAIAVSAIGRGLAPLSTLAASAADISPTNWELQVTPESLRTAELAPLTLAMTAMLASLQRAFTSQRAFLADAAHELKTPVAILKSTLQSHLQRPRSNEEYRAAMEAAMEDTNRLEKLVHSMLRLARAEQWAAGSLQRELEEIDLTSTCELSIARLRPLADARQVNVNLTPDGAPKLRADMEDMQLVWGNLLENAIQYSPAQSNVTMAIRQVGSCAEIAVQDEGLGIPEPDIPRIFDRFHRADNSRARSTGGYGLGLAIAKAIVEAYGGTIAAASTVGSGTTITVRLPIKS